MTTVPVNSPRGVAIDRVDRVDTVAEGVRTPWGAIMMGAVTSIGLQFIFTAMGIALGITLTDAANATVNDAGTISTTAFIWWLVTGTISLFVGGAVVGRWLGVARQITVCITAATMWSVVALFGFFVVWSGAGMTMSAASPFAVASQRYAEIGQIGYGYGEAVGSGDVATGVAATDRNGVNGANANVNEDAARTYAEEAQSALQTASWWSVIGLILGVIAAWSGAEIGARVLNRNETVPAH